MSGVWVMKNGVLKLVENPAAEEESSQMKEKVLVHLPTNEDITSYSNLQLKLSELGWERHYEDPDLLQFHKPSSIDLIYLPKDFNDFKPMHMHDIVTKNRNVFQVRDV